MPAFNSVAGVPMTAHVPLLRGYLREELGFEGVILSDYTAIEELIDHGVAADRAEAAALALKAGVDMDMVSGVYLAGLPEALSRGLVDEAEIDAAARRVLSLKMKLGLFDDPYRRAGARTNPPEDAKTLALDIARRAITLLTNRGALPLSAATRRIAVIGPLADARAEMLGPWALAGKAEDGASFLEGLRSALPDCEIRYEPGVTIAGEDERGVKAARKIFAGADVAILCLGKSASMSGEAASRARPGLPGRQRQLAEAVLAAGVPVIALLSSGRPLIVPWLAERSQALLATWFLGAGAGQAVAEVLTGRFDPTGRLAVTWPRDRGQIPIFFAQRSGGRPEDPPIPTPAIHRSGDRAAVSLRPWPFLCPCRIVQPSRLSPKFFERGSHPRRSGRAQPVGQGHAGNHFPVRPRSGRRRRAAHAGDEKLGQGRTRAA